MARSPRRSRCVLLVPLAPRSPAGGSDACSGRLPDGTAITVDSTKVSGGPLVRELRIIAANDRFAQVLKKQDDTKLVPKSGTVDPLVSQAWVNTRVNQAVAATSSPTGV